MPSTRTLQRRQRVPRAAAPARVGQQRGQAQAPRGLPTTSAQPWVRRRPTARRTAATKCRRSSCLELRACTPEGSRSWPFRSWRRPSWSQWPWKPRWTCISRRPGRRGRGKLGALRGGGRLTMVTTLVETIHARRTPAHASRNNFPPRSCTSPPYFR